MAAILCNNDEQFDQGETPLASGGIAGQCSNRTLLVFHNKTPVLKGFYSISDIYFILLLCKCPMKCHLMSSGNISCFSKIVLSRSSLVTPHTSIHLKLLKTSYKGTVLALIIIRILPKLLHKY